MSRIFDKVGSKPEIFWRFAQNQIQFYDYYLDEKHAVRSIETVFRDRETKEDKKLGTAIFV